MICSKKALIAALLLATGTTVVFAAEYTWTLYSFDDKGNKPRREEKTNIASDAECTREKNEYNKQMKPERFATCERKKKPGT